MTASTTEILKGILDDPTNLENVSKWVTPDVTYVSLNYSNPDLKRVMPWCGTSYGPQAIVQTFIDVARFWTVESFEEDATFGDDKNAAMFGKFVYRSTVLGKQVTSPFSAFAKIEGGKCVYLQFMEDTLATTESFRSGGNWKIQSDPDGEEFTL